MKDTGRYESWNKLNSEKLRYLEGHDNIRKYVSDEVVPFVWGFVCKDVCQKIRLERGREVRRIR
jgi:hypothetical protein